MAVMRPGAWLPRGVRALACFFDGSLWGGLVAGMMFGLKGPEGKICGLLLVILNFAARYSPTPPGNIALCCHAFHCDPASHYDGSCRFHGDNQD